ncbi:LOG family protein, partial [Ilumatobacter nonamiensis]|uniref:LOG family protein n=1 Tax=Ilumatobacter nonamiensis TaxID=467093 RepID=UPI00277D0AA6
AHGAPEQFTRTPEREGVCEHRRMANVVVFCGSSSGTAPAFRDAADELGTEIGTSGHRLVYGGGSVGLMGIVADATMRAGGEVVGVITEQLHALEVAHDGLDELVIESTMHARKARMASMAEGVVVLPGGFGTYDEVFEILTWNQLGLVSTPVVFLDVDGFYAPLLDFVRNAARAGFMKPDHAGLAGRATNAVDAVDLATRPAAAFTPKWVG